MRLKFLSLKGERGDASIFLAMILALGVGTTVYYNMDKLNQTLKSNKITSQKQKAETRNISGLSQAEALMSYTGANPSSNDPASLPYIYPDPYFPGTAIGTTRTAPNVTTWAFSGMRLEIKSPTDANLTASDFAAYVKDGTRPALNNKSVIRFVRPVPPTAPNLNLISEYEAEITSSSFDNQSLVSRAIISVPAPEKPTCILRSTDGQTKFQPNAPMSLELIVSGVAESALLPRSTEALLAPESEIEDHEPMSLTGRANSVRLINQQVATWQVVTPRPLVAVDGTNEVTFETYAYLTPVNNSSPTAIACPFRYTVTAPATCKLWTDKATVAPGQCVNITSETMGPVQGNSLKMAAADPTGKIIGGLTQNGANGTFCTPTASSFSTGVQVPKGAADAIAAALSGLSTDQQTALYNKLDDLINNLKTLFDKQPVLQNLSINQYNELLGFGDTQFNDMDKVVYDDYTYLKTLTAEQLDALKKMKKPDFNSIDKMKRLYLTDVTLLNDGSVSAQVLEDLSNFDSQLLMAYIGSALDAEAASKAPPVNYKILGTVTANDGTKNSCLVHVTAGNNKCEFFGSQFPNVTEQQTLTVVDDGEARTISFNFAPSKPNWEVAGIATSPTNVDPCPANARCFAIDFGGNRTPFTVVDSASSQSCNATTNLRVDLGCFEANTKIRMGDGTEKPIRQLKENDLVWNPIRQKAVAIKRVTPGPEKLPLWSVQTEDGLVRVTAKHPFLTPTGLKASDELKAGDRIMGPKGERIVLSVAENKDAPSEWVWNFELATDSKNPADHAILADGVVTGDLYLQEQLAKSKKKTLSQLKP